jgi:Zn-dependent peptidase ImmA (M78 family)
MKDKTISDENITKKIEKLLKVAGISKLPVDVTKIAEILGLNIKYQPYDDNFSGLLIRHGNEATIGVNSVHHENRRRFTIAHEIGHFLLHKGDLILDKDIRVNYRGAVNEHVDYEKEREANMFASELLMPTKLLSKDLKRHQLNLMDDEQIEELATKYQVSRQAFMIRISQKF